MNIVLVKRSVRVRFPLSKSNTFQRTPENRELRMGNSESLKPSPLTGHGRTETQAWRHAEIHEHGLVIKRLTEGNPHGCMAGHIEIGIIAAPQEAALPQNLELDENPHLFNKMGIIPYQSHQAPRGSIRMASSTLPGLDGFHRDAETSGKHFLGQARAVTDLLDLDRGKCIEFFDSTTMDNYFRLLALGSVKELVEGRRDVIVHFGHYGSSFRAGAYNMAQWL